MDLNRLKIKSHCIMEDAALYEHMRLALARGLPLHEEVAAHDRTAILVGSGPSVKSEIESIRKQWEERVLNGSVVVAVKDAHDWLIENEMTPDFAVAVDPQEHRWNCFTKKHPDVTYMIASQCHPAMFEHLAGNKVIVWHLYIREGQTYPPESILVTGGTTTGLRAITLFYSMGYRKFELYGFDSCLVDGALRADGTAAGRQIEIVCAGETFISTPQMAAQAEEFQNLFLTMPDMEVKSHGRGIISTILKERSKYLSNDKASFIHFGNDTMASYRYRCRIPAEQLQVPTNNIQARVVIFSKPTIHDVAVAKQIKADGRKVVVDFCDDHFDEQHYLDMAFLADAITCPTEQMSERIETATRGGWTPRPVVIPDPYEFPRKTPHCNGNNLLWFGHGVNYPGLQKILHFLDGYPLRAVSNVPGTIQWTPEIMPSEFARADIVVIPLTAAYKSCNRAVEAIRQGCFVVAEPHPSLEGIPGIWLGDIRKGVEWASQNPQLANERTLLAQENIERFAPERVGNAWRSLVEVLLYISAAGKSSGPGLPTSTASRAATSSPICENFPSTATQPIVS